MDRKTCFGVLMMMVLATGLLVGCGKQESKRKIRTRDGEVVEIDSATSRVAMKVFIDKNQTFITIDGTVTQETEILINDRPATLAELKIGDKVKVTGYSQGKGVDKQWVPTKIRVTRVDFFAPAESDGATESEAPAEGTPAAE